MKFSFKTVSGCSRVYAMRRWCAMAALISGLMGIARVASAESTFDISNYGAKGDAVHFSVNTVSNSTIVTTTNSFSTADIGKYIEIFGVGKPTYGANSYGVTTNGNQDLIAVVTNVVNGTNLYLKVVQISGATTNHLPQRTITAPATMGTDNTPIINSIISNNASLPNFTIYIPNGTYLCMSSLRPGGYAAFAIPLYRGGIRFRGESKDEAILLSRGAWQSWGDGPYPVRGFLFEVVAPITNDLPLVFENLTMDGGVKQGNLNVHGIQCNTVDGLGWDEQHSAYLTFDRGNNTGTASMQVFTNVNVIHWRGESFKSIDGNTNGVIDIQNCFFADICATALNIYPRWNVRNNVFSNCWQITEYYQKFYRGTAYFCNNLITNSLEQANRGLIGNAVSINGGYWKASPLIIQSNRLVNPCGYGMNVFITTPAANVSFLNNEVICPEYSQVFCIGAPGGQGADCNSNILISCNSLYCPGKLTTFVGFGDNGINAVYDLTVCSNKIVASELQHFTWVGPSAFNVRFFNNDASATPVAYVQTGVVGANNPFFLFETNNLYNPGVLYAETLKTNIVSYVGGPKAKIDFAQTGNTLIVEDSTAKQIPAGAVLCIDNTKNRWPVNGWGNGDMSGDVVVYPSQKPGTVPMKLANGTQLTFHWTGSQWSTNENRSNPLLPASNLRRTVNGTAVQ